MAGSTGSDNTQPTQRVCTSAACGVSSHPLQLCGVSLCSPSMFSLGGVLVRTLSSRGSLATGPCSQGRMIPANFSGWLLQMCSCLDHKVELAQLWCCPYPAPSRLPSSEGLQGVSTDTVTSAGTTWEKDCSPSKQLASTFFKAMGCGPGGHNHWPYPFQQPAAIINEDLWWKQPNRFPFREQRMKAKMTHL